MWEDREALAGLSLADRDRILDVGCGTGELTTVIADESTAEIYGVDASVSLLKTLDFATRIQGDAERLPFVLDVFDLVVCQALLVNLVDPSAAIAEFSRVSRELVAVIEPDNSQVTVESTVREESTLAEQARVAYTAGVATDVSLGSRTMDLFREVGFTEVSTTRYDFERTTTPPYSTYDYQSARMKRNATRIIDHRDTLLNGSMSPSEFSELRTEWRDMGRSVLEQMSDEAYERTEIIPFYVTVGRVPAGG